MRKPSACTACRARRRKCNISQGLNSCIYCTSRGIPCIQEPPPGGYYDQNQSRYPDHNTEQPEDKLEVPDVYAGSFPPMGLRLQLVQLYFDYIHNQFHTLFHPPTFMEDVAAERVPHVILFAMFALSARFSNDPSFSHTKPRERGAIYLNTGSKLFNIRDSSLYSVQAAVLLGAGCIAEQDDVGENIYYSVACRMAQILDLPNCPVSTELERQINIRVWSSLCMVDVWSSTNVKLPKFMPNTQVILPMDELQFLALRGNAGDAHLMQLRIPSPLIPEMIKLNRILLAINDFNESCVIEQPSGLMLEHAIHGLSRRLDDWKGELPDNMQDTEENFAWWASQGLGRTFAAVYLGYYHFGQLLFYQFLHVEPYSATPSAPIYAEKCKDHAAKLCEMIHRAFAVPNSDVLYAMVAHVLVIASTVQIHTLLFSEDERQINIARSRLEHNFKILLHLRSFWSTLDGAMMRLRAFHDTCRKSMETSFVFDRWMLKFLVEFAKPVEEKGLEEQTSPSEYWTLEDIAR